MRYYLNTCTQTKSESGDYTDYGKKETSGTGEAARLNAIADLHNTYASNIKKANIQYWMGKVEDGEGNVIDKLKVGEYVDTENIPEPESDDELI